MQSGIFRSALTIRKEIMMVTTAIIDPIEDYLRDNPKTKISIDETP